VWIETISQWQGVSYNAGKNISSFGNSSVFLKSNATAFVQPGDAATSLFIVWSANADFVNFASDGTPWASGSLTTWNNKITQSINDHTTAINTLYNKGARLIVMPNAANVSAIPLYNSKSSTEKNFFRDRVISFNTQFTTAMNTLAASKVDLKIIIPDVFNFFEQVQVSPALYGMLNPVPNNAAVIYLADKSFTGPGANYMFWDSWHPTAKFQMYLAAFIQQIISPVKVNSVSLSGLNVQIQLANIPLGRAGSIQGSANLQPPWAEDYPFTESFVAGGSTTKTYTFATSGSKRFYRAAFPVVWVWP
jgi:phospholipase/lecithinase/hemolysin